MVVMVSALLLVLCALLLQLVAVAIDGAEALQAPFICGNELPTEFPPNYLPPSCAATAALPAHPSSPDRTSSAASAIYIHLLKLFTTFSRTAAAQDWPRASVRL
jgi:hypothetical protein